MRISFTGLNPIRSFFDPSFRLIRRPIQPTNNSHCTTNTPQSRYFSFNSGGSNSRSGPGGPAIKGAQSTAATPGAKSGPRDTTTTTTTTATGTTSTSLLNSTKVEEHVHTATPLAASIPHASPGIVGLDVFFALHRPLLELPLRITARKTLTPIPRLVALDELDAASIRGANAKEVEESMDELDGEDLVEVVDLAPDGTPMGPSYITTLSSTRAREPSRTPEEEEELRDLEHEANEAALQDIEDGLPDPYAAWLIAEHEPNSLTPAVSRYLASHPPFTAPPPPAPLPTFASSAAAPSPSLLTGSSPSPSSILTPQARSDLAFLRPFPLASTPSPLASAASTAPADPSESFAASFVAPLSPSAAAQICDRFLSSASLSHRWQSQIHYVTHVTEPLEIARRKYDGIETPRRGFFESRKKGEVRVWSDNKGWETANLGSKGSSWSPFMPAEMVDLDWEDEEAERRALLGSHVRMDSVQRKRRKKITKHKFKKRRKAQQAMRKRMGK